MHPERRADLETTLQNRLYLAFASFYETIEHETGRAVVQQGHDAANETVDKVMALVRADLNDRECAALKAS
jgi:hypothetical protein